MGCLGVGYKETLYCNRRSSTHSLNHRPTLLSITLQCELFSSSLSWLASSLRLLKQTTCKSSPFLFLSPQATPTARLVVLQS